MNVPFTASNGAQVILTNAGKTGYVMSEKDDAIQSAYLDFDAMRAWREFAQAERDEALGRWRWPENPDYVVYKYPGDEDCYVVNERAPGDPTYYTRSAANEVGRNAGAGAARAYFAAHPEPKPWHDAKPGEVWALRFGVSPDEVACVRRSEHFTALDPDEWFDTVGVTASEITAGRRVWPEEANA